MTYQRSASQVVFYTQYPEAHEAAKRAVLSQYNAKVQEFSGNVAIGGVMLVWKGNRLALSLSGRVDGVSPQAAKSFARDLSAAAMYADTFTANMG
jgi:hypothetical protein